MTFDNNHFFRHGYQYLPTFLVAFYHILNLQEFVEKGINRKKHILSTAIANGLVGKDIFLLFIASKLCQMFMSEVAVHMTTVLICRAQRFEQVSKRSSEIVASSENLWWM